MATGRPGGFSVEFAEDISVEGTATSFAANLFRARPKAEFVSKCNSCRSVLLNYGR